MKQFMYMWQSMVNFTPPRLETIYHQGAPLKSTSAFRGKFLGWCNNWKIGKIDPFLSPPKGMHVMHTLELIFHAVANVIMTWSYDGYMARKLNIFKGQRRPKMVTCVTTHRMTPRSDVAMTWNWQHHGLKIGVQQMCVCVKSEPLIWKCWERRIW